MKIHRPKSYKKIIPQWVHKYIIAVFFWYAIWYWVNWIQTGYFTLSEISANISWMIIFLTPAMAANASPVIARKRKTRTTPICESVFGKNKTRRWLIVWVFASYITFWLMIRLWFVTLTQLDNILNRSIFPKNLFELRYHIRPILLWIGAIWWDMIESAIKRKIKIAPWQPFIPRDQTDYIFWICLITSRLYPRSAHQIIYFCLFGGSISYIAHFTGYLLKMIDTKK